MTSMANCAICKQPDQSNLKGLKLCRNRKSVHIFGYSFPEIFCMFSIQQEVKKLVNYAIFICKILDNFNVYVTIKKIAFI